jgi:hypothetical protein
MSDSYMFLRMVDLTLLSTRDADAVSRRTCLIGNVAL